MRAKTVNFERNGDPFKTMKIGSHRELAGQDLIDAVFANIYYNDLETDPKFAKIEPLILHDNVYNWIFTAIQDPETEEARTMSPDEITSDDYRNFYDEIHEDDEDEDEEDWDDELPGDWEDEE